MKLKKLIDLNMGKLVFLKLKYILNRFLYFFLGLDVVKILLKIFNYFKEYFFILRYSMEEDLFILREKLNQWKNIYFNFGFFRHIFFLFFLITGIIPLFFFIYLCFFFFKYICKYLFLTMDYFFYFLNGKKFYIFLKTIINNFFYLIPYYLLKLYRYFFGGGWIRFFWDKFKNYWKNKWWNFLNSFFSVTDDIILVKSPKIYTKSKEKTIDFYYWSVRIFFLFQRKIKDGIKFFKNIFYRIIRRIKKRNRLIKRIYDHWFRKYYYLWYFWYIRTYIYYAWIFRKYIWSDAFIVTLEAFFFIAFWNSVACVKYSIALVYTRLEYIYAEIFLGFWVKIISLELYLSNFLKYLSYEWKGLFIDIKSYLLEFLRSLIFNFSIWFYQIVFASPYGWYWWKHECYEVDKGFISLMWWSLKFYAVIQRFFRRLHPLPWRLFLFNKKIYHLGAFIIYESLVRVIWRRFIEGCHFMFYIKFIYFI